MLKLYNTYEIVISMVILVISILKKYDYFHNFNLLPSLTVLILSLGILIFYKSKIIINKNKTNKWALIQTLLILFLWQKIYFAIIAFLILKLFSYKLNSAVFILNYLFFISLYFIPYSNIYILILLLITTFHYSFYIENPKLILASLAGLILLSVIFNIVILQTLLVISIIISIYLFIIAIQKYTVIKIINKFLINFCIWSISLFVLTNTLISLQNADSIINIIFNISLVGITTGITLLLYFLFDIIYKLVIKVIKFIIFKTNIIYQKIISSIIAIVINIQNLIGKLIQRRVRKKTLISKWINTFN